MCKDISGVYVLSLSLSLSLSLRSKRKSESTITISSAKSTGVMLLMPALPTAVHKEGSFGVDFRPTTCGSSIQKNRFLIREYVVSVF